MSRNRAVVVIVGGLAWLTLTGRSHAQYDCPVGVEVQGKTVLRGRILDEERPSTAALWQTLAGLSLERANDSVPDAKSTERTTLKGDVRVVIDGAGSVRLTQLELVRNPYNASQWIIAPDNVARILKLRNVKK